MNPPSEKSVAETILSRSFPTESETGLSQLLSLTADSPDLLAIIKAEGKV